MKKHFIILIVISLAFLLPVNNVNAFPFAQIFKAVSKFFSKAASKAGDDVTTKITKAAGDDGIKKVTENSDEVFKKLRELSNEESILNIKNSSSDKILSDHNVINVAEKVASNDTVRENVYGFFQGARFTARTFLNSDYFNNPNLTKKNSLICQTDREFFNFTLLINEKDKNWILLTDNYIASKDNNFTKIKKQELIVIKENDEFLFFATQIKKDKKFPSEYFIISKEGKFLFYENYLNEDVEKLISNQIKENVDNSKFKCEKINH